MAGLILNCFLVSQPGTLYQHRQSPWGLVLSLFPVAARLCSLVNLFLPVAIARLQFGSERTMLK